MTRTQAGLHWRKLDLHVHTPASTDYTGPVITPDEFVAKAIAKGLNAIAVTDHNTGAWIDPIVAAAKGTGLIVFPGVEITVTGGKNGIHIIALFDCDATTKTIENLLANLKFEAKSYGNLDAISPMGPDAVVDAINQAGGLAILAHADSGKGVLHDMTGQQRINVMNSPHLAAVEVTNITKTAPFCSGADANYKRKLAYYRASDNRTPVTDNGHSIDGIGTRYSWFKSDGLSLDALRQVFNDPDQRIKCDEDSTHIPDKMYPRVLSLHVPNGFLKGMTFDFHEGLNSIIGGKGVGKSLVVEFLRFGLSQPSMIEDICHDMDGKLSHQLGLGSQVVVRVQLEADQIIEVTRTFDSATNPTKAVYVSSGKRVPGNIAQLFPILAYSQTETLEIAKDNTAQLGLIDSLLDLATIESQIETIESELDQSDIEIAAAQAAEEQLEKAERDLETHEEKIKQVDRALKSKELDALKELKPKSECMKKVQDFADAIENAVLDLSSTLKDSAPPKLPASLAGDIELQSLLDELHTETRDLIASAKSLEADVSRVVKRARSATIAWDKTVASRKKAYAAWIATQGGDRSALLARKTVLEEQRPILADIVASIKQKIKALPKLRIQRTKLLGQLDSEVDKRHALRKAKYDELTKVSNGRLELQLIKGGERLRYVEALSVLKTGSRVQDSTIEQICKEVEPRTLLKLVDTNDSDGLAKAAHIPAASSRALASHLSSSTNVVGLLSLEHGQLLHDKPTIRFRKDDGKYYELSELSVGQKCTALLIIALANGARPIIIDQPEDALDITSVYEDVTLHLRGHKHARQFIVTTHNPTVAVASDSDQFHVLKASATQAYLSTEGAIDLPVVRAAVIQHLEGGAEPFALKTKKYGLPAQ